MSVKKKIKLEDAVASSRWTRRWDNVSIECLRPRSRQLGSRHEGRRGSGWLTGMPLCAVLLCRREEFWAMPREGRASGGNACSFGVNRQPKNDFTLQLHLTHERVCSFFAMAGIESAAAQWVPHPALNKNLRRFKVQAREAKWAVHWANANFCSRAKSLKSSLSFFFFF